MLVKSSSLMFFTFLGYAKVYFQFIVALALGLSRDLNYLLIFDDFGFTMKAKDSGRVFFVALARRASTTWLVLHRMPITP